MIVVWAVLVSFLPLIASLWLLVYLSPYIYPERFIFSGIVSIKSDGSFRAGKSKGQVDYCIRFYSALALLLKTKQGESFVIWRDGCDEAEYRQLKCFLEQIDRHKKSDHFRSLNS
ncbi:hypothetical protein [Vibrio sp. SCSIO 43137]|uniref:hypothetical protein n=1 Tax=Vibrio sp. SCSIO 43137 TaxID=3021011 RepID=UPI0023080DD3|nr:hypothetical protein [Vibrio sp. SCSIO 43137]WCE30163.1 hypothetical protein PK654_02405 [Vibrio sp. SCSIO 43137]